MTNNNDVRIALRSNDEWAFNCCRPRQQMTEDQQILYNVPRPVDAQQETCFCADHRGKDEILPINLLVGEILPFLDRTSGFSFLASSKKVYNESQKSYVPPWPVGGFYDGLLGVLVLSMKFSPDLSTLALGCSDGKIRLWNSRACRRRTLQASSSVTIPILSLAFSPNGRLLASASQDGAIRLFRMFGLNSSEQGEDGTGELNLHQEGEKTRFQWITFSFDSNLIVSSSWDETIRLWRVKDGLCMRTIPGQAYGVNSVSFSPDNKTFATVRTVDGGLLFWNLHSGMSWSWFQKCHPQAHHHPGIRRVVFSPDNVHVATAAGILHGDQCIRLWNIANGECVNIFRGHSSCVESMVFSGDGQRLASSSHDHRNSILVWSVTEGTRLKTISGYHLFGPLTLAFSQDGRTLAANLNQACYIFNI